MELTWYGLGCFRIVERGYPAIVTDPFDVEETGLTLPRSRTPVVLSSTLLDEPEKVRWRGLRGVAHTLAGPGEYEIGGVFITGIVSYKDRKRGAQLGQNVIYTIEINGAVVCHLGELGHVLTQAQVEAIGPVNVLLIPVGIVNGLTPAMASEIVSLVEPDVVVPMQYKTPGLKVERRSVHRFLKEMGVAQATPVPTLKVSVGRAAEETRVVLMEART